MTRPPQGDHRLLPHLRDLAAVAYQAQAQRRKHAALVERELDLDEDGSMARRRVRPGTAPGDPRDLRGIPVVGVVGGAGGASPGTRPTDAIGRADRAREIA